MILPIPDELLEALIDRFAAGVVARLEPVLAGAGAGSPWLTMEEAIDYSRIPEGTFRKEVATGSIPSHSLHGEGRRKFFRREELDAVLGYESRAAGAVPLRRVS